MVPRVLLRSGLRTLAVTRPGFPTADLHFKIVNRGPCATGGADHSIRLVCASSGDIGEVASVESGALPPNGSATFDLTLPSSQESCFYRIVVDASGSEFESLDSNNTADTPPFGP